MTVIEILEKFWREEDSEMEKIEHEVFWEDMHKILRGHDRMQACPRDCFVISATQNAAANPYEIRIDSERRGSGASLD
jgi:hypothetical protein